MRKITFVLLLTSITSILLAPSTSSAEYNPTTGRFLQRDPLGVNPNAQRPNRFAVHDQYKDGMCLYEYVTSEPMRNADPYGKSALAHNAFSFYLNRRFNVCCKIKIDYRNSLPFRGGWQPLGQSGRLKPYLCEQHSIPNLRGLKPMAACECAYKNYKYITVYGANAGLCCSCNVYLDFVSIKGYLLTHPYLIINCPAIGWKWTIDAAGPGTDYLDFKEHPGLKPQIFPKINNPKFSQYRHIGTTSCETAAKFVSELENSTYTYEQPFRECNYWAWKWARDLVQRCP